jgi:hypothetical protein
MGASEIERMAGMADRYRRPDWVRRLNAMGDSVGGSIVGARRLVPLDADELLEAASADLGGASSVTSVIHAGASASRPSCGRWTTRRCTSSGA